MRAKNFVNIVMIVFYLFYALLPLLYTAESGILEEHAGNAYTHQASDLRATDSIIQFLVPPEEQDNSEASTGPDFLLKKKRTIAPSLKDALTESFPSLVKNSDFEALFKTPFASLETDNTLNCLDVFVYYHSGISPPLF
jgi:hypothetical protein